MRRPGWLTARRANLLGVAATLSMMGAALYFQHGMGLEPCPLCIIQRVATVALGIVFLLAFLHGTGPVRSRVHGLIIAGTAAAGASVSARHVWLQSMPADQVPACGPGLDYLMDVFSFTEAMRQVFRGSGECAEVVWSLLGLSMPAWVFVCLVTLGLWGLFLNWGHGRAESRAA